MLHSHNKVPAGSTALDLPTICVVRSEVRMDGPGGSARLKLDLVAMSVARVVGGRSLGVIERVFHCVLCHISWSHGVVDGWWSMHS